MKPTRGDKIPKTDRPTENEALGRLKKLTAEEIKENRRKAEEAKEAQMRIRIGNFGNMGTRRRGSAEAQHLRTQPLSRTEITGHAIAGTTVTFYTKSGTPVTMPVAEARQQGLVGTGR